MTSMNGTDLWSVRSLFKNIPQVQNILHRLLMQLATSCRAVFVDFPSCKHADLDRLDPASECLFRIMFLTFSARMSQVNWLERFSGDVILRSWFRYKGNFPFRHAFDMQAKAKHRITATTNGCNSLILHRRRLEVPFVQFILLSATCAAATQFFSSMAAFVSLKLLGFLAS